MVKKNQTFSWECNFWWDFCAWYSTFGTWCAPCSHKPIWTWPVDWRCWPITTMHICPPFRLAATISTPPDSSGMLNILRFFEVKWLSFVTHAKFWLCRNIWSGSTVIGHIDVHGVQDRKVLDLAFWYQPGSYVSQIADVKPVACIVTNQQNSCGWMLANHPILSCSTGMVPWGCFSKLVSLHPQISPAFF